MFVSCLPGVERGVRVMGDSRAFFGFVTAAWFVGFGRWYFVDVLDL